MRQWTIDSHQKSLNIFLQFYCHRGCTKNIKRKFATAPAWMNSGQITVCNIVMQVFSTGSYPMYSSDTVMKPQFFDEHDPSQRSEFRSFIFSHYTFLRFSPRKWPRHLLWVLFEIHARYNSIKELTPFCGWLIRDSRVPLLYSYTNGRRLIW